MSILYTVPGFEFRPLKYESPVIARAILFINDLSFNVFETVVDKYDPLKSREELNVNNKILSIHLVHLFDSSSVATFYLRTPHLSY